MKYKAGDKVKIKTWEQMEKEFGLDQFNNLDREVIKGEAVPVAFIKEMEREINKNFLDRILTIKNIVRHSNEDYYYQMEEIGYYWDDGVIECLVEGYKESVPITSRWELLDL